MTISEGLGAATAKAEVPRGWEPYTQHTDQIGQAIVKLPSPNATARDLLITAGFNPDEWQIDGGVETRKWMRYDQEWLFYYKFKVVAGESPELVTQHVDDIVKRIRRRRPAVKKTVTDADAFGVFMSDLQIGKAEGGVGTDEIADRWVGGVVQAKARIKELRRIGRLMPHGALVGLGDIVEGCFGNYPNQPFLIDRNRRDQLKISRELIYHTIDELEPLFDRFTIAAVAGNHGENRQGLQAKVTDDADNDDVACFEAVREAYDRAGRTDLEWLIPHDELSIALELGGVKVAAAHGHTFRGGGTPQQKAKAWFQGQDFGYGVVRDSQILVSAHFHHFLATQLGTRTMFQTPPADAGSKHFREFSGDDSLPAILTMRFDSSRALGYDDLKLLELA